ncbi:hypothetical protein CDD83_8103 [Cordyceps sp. RAO-2017]|nr:hypothetical protein CDD83_8103 [Cordyceps sp. RAO-2017]
MAGSHGARFAPFARLPVELRLHIWNDSLADMDPPGFSVYDWRWMGEWENDFYSNWPVRRPPGPRVQVGPMPAAAFVNREAREAVRAWAKARGLFVRTCWESGAHYLHREWQPERDTLVVGTEAWPAFTHLFSTGFLALWRQPFPFLDALQAMQHLAVTREILPELTGRNCPHRMCDRFRQLKTLSVVTGAPSHLGQLDRPLGAVSEFTKRPRAEDTVVDWLDVEQELHLLREPRWVPNNRDGGRHTDPTAGQGHYMSLIGRGGRRGLIRLDTMIIRKASESSR